MEFDLKWYFKDPNTSMNQCIPEYIQIFEKILKKSLKEILPILADTPASRANQINQMEQLACVGYYRVRVGDLASNVVELPLFFGDLKRCIRWLCRGLFLRLCGINSGMVSENPWWDYFPAMEDHREFSACLPDVTYLISALIDLAIPWNIDVKQNPGSWNPVFLNVFEIVAVTPYKWEVYWGPYDRPAHFPPICYVSIAHPSMLDINHPHQDLIDQVMKFAFVEGYRGYRDFWGYDCRYPCDHCGYEYLVPDDTECPKCHNVTKKYEYVLHIPPLVEDSHEDEDDVNASDNTPTSPPEKPNKGTGLEFMGL